MKKIILFITILFLFSQFLMNFSFAQTTTTTTTTTTSALPPGFGSLKDIYNFFASINPFLLLILGIVILVVAKLSKYIAIVLIIFALIQIILLLLR